MGHGFDENKLRRNLDALLGRWVDENDLPCVQAVVTRRGELAYSRALGWADASAKRALQDDAIFRAWSMSKAFTSCCMMMLHERGLYKMHDPVSKFIPEFKGMRVAETDAAGHVALVAPKREIIIRDLFTMASGIPYPGTDTLPERQMMQVQLRMERDARAGKHWSTQKCVRETAKNTSLNFHPGEHWWYGYSIDILGALVEVLSGQRLGEFMRERIFDPLGLSDTSFRISDKKLSRLVSAYAFDRNGKPTVDVSGKFLDSYRAPEDAFESGGGGLLSTAHDMNRFAQMLLGFGELGGVRILSRKSVELMRTNHLSPQQLLDYNWDTQRGYGYGLAMRTMMHPEIAGYGSVGEFGWDGMMGTWFSVDPAEQMTMVFMAQINPGMHYRFIPHFAQTVYGAIGD